MNKDKKFKILIVGIILSVIFLSTILYTYEESTCGYFSGYAWTRNSFPFTGINAEISIDDGEFINYHVYENNCINNSVWFDGYEIGEFKYEQVCLVYMRNIYGLRFLMEINYEVIV